MRQWYESAKAQGNEHARQVLELYGAPDSIQEAFAFLQYKVFLQEKTIQNLQKTVEETKILNDKIEQEKQQLFQHVTNLSEIITPLVTKISFLSNANNGYAFGPAALKPKKRKKMATQAEPRVDATHELETKEDVEMAAVKANGDSFAVTDSHVLATTKKTKLG